MSESTPQMVGGLQASPGLMVGRWQLWPRVSAGVIYNSNVNQDSGKNSASWGEYLTPALSANLDNGIYQTSIYGVANINNYANSAVNNKTTVDASAGFSQAYRPTHDLTFRLTGGYARALDVFGNATLATFATPNTLPPPTSAAPVPATTVSPQANANRNNQYSGAVSVDKDFGKVGIGLTASAVDIIYDSSPVNAPSRNGVTYTVAQRTRFNLTPQLYAFVDPSVNWQRYQDSTRNSNGYRITGGVGTQKGGIWGGEVYGGYQAERNDITGTYGRPVLGLRIIYSPTPTWLFNASLDESLGASTVPVSGTAGLGTSVTTALLHVTYNGLPPSWSTSATFGYVRTDYIASPRLDNGWLAGASISYGFWRNFGITLHYQFKSVDSNAQLQSFNQNVVSLGVSYHY
jgi:hypothetical protein